MKDGLAGRNKKQIIGKNEKGREGGNPKYAALKGLPLKRGEKIYGICAYELMKKRYWVGFV